MKKFLKGIKSKQILVLGLCVLVTVAGYYRWRVAQNINSVSVMNDEVVDRPETDAHEGGGGVSEDENMAYTTDYFAKARYERDCSRSEAAELLKVSGGDGETSEELAAKNREMLEGFAKNMESETAIENMVIAKGYSDCVAFVDDSGVRVIVKSDTLAAESVAQIKDIVVSETGAKATDIKISTKK